MSQDTYKGYINKIKDGVVFYLIVGEKGEVEFEYPATFFPNIADVYEGAYFNLIMKNGPYSKSLSFQKIEDEKDDLDETFDKLGIT